MFIRWEGWRRRRKLFKASGLVGSIVSAACPVVRSSKVPKTEEQVEIRVPRFVELWGKSHKYKK
jgi:hypothetical protein